MTEPLLPLRRSPDFRRYWIARMRADLANAIVLGSVPVAYALGGLTAPHVLLAAFVAAVVAWLSPLRGIDVESQRLKV
ncbi:MAG TPA: hypothetical protein VGJ63_09525 [Micromonosporaceae bacterium]